MKSLNQFCKPLFASFLCFVLSVCFDANADLADALIFHAPFDASPNAAKAGGDALIFTAKSLKREEISAGLPSHVSLAPTGGRFGGCLRFSDVSEQVVMFRGDGNVSYANDSHDSTISLWLKVDPKNGLKPGFVDPLQVTDKKWNDASLFLDFTKDDSPRHFRLGVFSDFKHWNPNNLEFDNLSSEERPMVVESTPPFTGDRWTHVAFTLARVNGMNSAASLYIDGKLVGALNRDQKITWDVKKIAIMLGIQYIGDIDDFAIFDRILTETEIRQVMNDGVSLATGRTALKNANVDGSGSDSGWRTLGEADFVNVNCHDDTWEWKDGTAFCTGKPVGVIRSKEMIKNFELVCEWKHKKKGGNSGVFVWASQKSIDQLAMGKGRLTSRTMAPARSATNRAALLQAL